MKGSYTDDAIQASTSTMRKLGSSLSQKHQYGPWSQRKVQGEMAASPHRMLEWLAVEAPPAAHLLSVTMMWTDKTWHSGMKRLSLMESYGTMLMGKRGNAVRQVHW